MQEEKKYAIREVVTALPLFKYFEKKIPISEIIRIRNEFPNKSFNKHVKIIENMQEAA